MSTRPAWSRIVLKLSGEALAEPSGFGLDSSVLSQVAEEVREAREELGTDIAIVVGGGNFWRGLKGAGQGMDQAQRLQSPIFVVAPSATLKKVVLSSLLVEPVTHSSLLTLQLPCELPKLTLKSS
jgi:uridylate kinase